MPRALLSVSDKAGLVDFARGLAQLGWELVSTGGTATALREAGLEVRDVDEITGHPEMMEGRVKTLHPAVHAGILSRRTTEDTAELAKQGYGQFDLVGVNLYPFRETVAAGAIMAEAMEKVDVGGPTMLRAAAKNHAHVLVVVDPDDYDRVLKALRTGQITNELRRELAAKVFAHTAAYDQAIAEYMAGGNATSDEGSGFPAKLDLSLSKVQDLRYGENPEQPAAFYAEESPPPGSLPHLRQLHGKELSFNNMLDLDAAVQALSAWHGVEEGAVCVIIKHTTPCGLALRPTLHQAFVGARDTDSLSAFGGIIGVNGIVDGDTALEIAETFFEVVVAPGFAPEAREVLAKKPSLRLIELPITLAGDELDYKRVRGGLLVQSRMSMRFPEDGWRVVTRREPTAEEWRDLRFVWRVTAMVKSNAVVFARNGQTLGIGAGQMSRVDSARVAIMKASDQGFDLAGAAVGSDAFFPFRDGVDVAAEAGATAIIQPGGSMRDEEVIAAADEHGMAMVFTGRRVFRH